MAQAERVEVLNVNHPGSNTRIDAAKYEAVRRAILDVVPADEAGVPFGELPGLVERVLPGKVIPGGGSIGWYTTTVKLDLEARGEIERVPGVSPQRLRRIDG